MSVWKCVCRWRLDYLAQPVCPTIQGVPLFVGEFVAVVGLHEHVSLGVVQHFLRHDL